MARDQFEVNRPVLRSIPKGVLGRLVQAEGRGLGDEYPYLAEVVEELAKKGYDYTEEFEFGLGFILDGLDSLWSKIGRSAV